MEHFTKLMREGYLVTLDKSKKKSSIFAMEFVSFQEYRSILWTSYPKYIKQYNSPDEKPFVKVF